MSDAMQLALFIGTMAASAAGVLLWIKHRDRKERAAAGVKGGGDAQG